MTPPALETARLRLRPFTPDDAELLIALDADPAVMRHITNGIPTAPGTIRDTHLPRILATPGPGGMPGFWAAEERATGAFVGWFLFRPDKLEPAWTELGYRFMKSAWGRGYATEGGRELVARGFREWGVTVATANAAAAHGASRRVMEKCGLRYLRDHTFPVEHGYGEHDDRSGVIYAVTREEWLAAGGGRGADESQTGAGG